ncbi:zinc finger, CCHC-type containing protein, partial [Tanacetum coccineum]
MINVQQVGVVRSAHLYGVIMIIIWGEAPNDEGPGAVPLVAGSKGRQPLAGSKGQSPWLGSSCQVSLEIHQTTAPYTPQQNGVAERKNRTLKEMVNSMLSYSGLSEGAVVRLTEPKMKNLGEKCIDCIFIGYAEHSKCYRFYVIEPNDYVSVNSIIESRDAMFDEERFTSIPRPRGMIQPSSSKIAEDEVEGTDDVPGPSVPRKSTRTRKAKSFGSDFQLYLVEGTRDKTLSQREYCFIIEEDPRTLSEAMASRDVAFWKEAVQSEIDSIMHNDTWELTDLPPGCKALGCKWILKRKMKVDGSI